MIYQELQSQLGLSFKNSDLLEGALTHRSFYFENRGTTKLHFERLEFLGDSVLGLIIADLLMAGFLQQEEGELTKWRASLVNEATLAQMAKELELQKYLRLGNSEANQRETLSARVLSSALEAVIGAVYLDSGFSKVHELVSRMFASRLEQLSSTNHYAEDSKTRLQEYSQKKYKSTPVYTLLTSEGPAHSKQFSTEVVVGAKFSAIGKGPSRRASEQEAARLVFLKIDSELTGDKK